MNTTTRFASRLRLGGWAGGCALAILLGQAFAAVAAEENKPADLMGDIVADMKVATNWLAKLTTDLVTQKPQQDAVEKLDALIADLEKECDKCKGCRSSANPTRPLRDSVVKGGPGGMGKLHAAEEQGKHWADLPPHERERILQSMTEGFPAHYQNVLEAYFKRVAEEKPVKQEEASSTSRGADGSSGKPSPPQSAPAPGASQPSERP